ncbi:MAG: hypothetical protein M3Y72_06435 [Acidobacteriota bacterium]|nr:hypothetical protein [Acidobacteriota bacterium]
MTITLSPQHERLIADALRTGAYQNPDEVLGRALELLHSEDEWLQEQKDSIEAEIERAFAQCERDEYLSPDQSQSDMEKRKAGWLADRRSS